MKSGFILAQCVFVEHDKVHKALQGVFHGFLKKRKHVFDITSEVKI